MSVKIVSNISSLEQINSSLNSNNIEKTLSKTISNLNLVLKKLEININEGFTPLTEILRPEVITVLHNLDKTLNTLGNKIDQTVKNTLMKVEAVIQSAPVHDKKEIPLPLEIKPLAFYCDIESPDHNEGIWRMAKRALEQGIPFVTTRSLIRGTGFENPYVTKIATFYSEVEQHLLTQQNHWDVFQKGEMLVFMPHSYLTEKSPQEKLASYDFKIDGSLKPISMQEVLQGPQNKCDIDGFIDLFAYDPKENVFLFLAGHGFTDMVGGLREKQFNKLLHFLERFKGLAVQSCFSGGQSSLMHLPDPAKTADFFSQDKPHSFPTIVRSMGDFTAIAVLDEDFKTFLAEFASFIGSDKGQTPQQLKRRMEKLETGKENQIRNVIQYYPAHGAGSPTAFRSLGNGTKSFVITYPLVKRTELASGKPFKGEPQEIVVNNAEHLEVYPLVIRVPIRCVNKNPILLSKAPGKGHHYIHQIDLANENALKFIESNIEFYKSMGLGNDPIYGQSKVEKSFLIRRFTLPNSTKYLENVGLYFLSSGTVYTFLYQNKYYYYDKEGKIEVDPLTYAIINFELILATKGEEKAVRAMSAGQETDADFMEAICAANFLPDPFFSLFNFKNNSVSCTPNFMEEIEKTSLEQRMSIVIFLLRHGMSDLAFELYQKNQMDFNLADFTGNSLIDLAIKADAVEFVKYALSQKIDPKILNKKNSAGMPPLHFAIRRLKKAYDQQEKGVPDAEKTVAMREKILDLLLKNPQIDLGITNSSGWNCLIDALPNRTLVNLLVQKGVEIKGLSWFIGKKDYQSVDILLELKADPNENRALEIAITLNDHKLVEKLLQAGAKVETRDLNLAIFKASPAILELLLASGTCKPEITDWDGVSPLFSAMICGNTEKINMLKAKGACLPNRFDYTRKLLFGIFERILNRNDKSSLIELLHHAPHFNIACELFKYLLDKDVALLKELIAQDHINVNEMGEVNGNGYYRPHTSILQFILDHTQNQELIELSFNRVADFNKSCFFNALIKHGRLEWIQSAVQQKGANVQGEPGEMLPLQSADLSTESGKQIFKWLVEQGADLNARGKETPFCHAIESGDFELIKYCLDKGAKIVLKDGTWVSPLAFAATMKKENSGEIFKYLFLKTNGNINAPGLPPYPTLFAALAHHGDVALIEWALERGAEVNPAISNDLKSPICLAAERTDDRELLVFKRLIKAGAVLNQLTEDALKSLFRSGNKGLVEYCYENGAKDKILEMKYWGIQGGILSKNAELFQFLMDKYQMKGHFDFFWTGVKEAYAEIATEGNLAMMEILLKSQPQGYGLYPRYEEVISGEKKTSFFECAIKAQPAPRTEIIRLLLDHGDDPRRQIDGAPALVYAVKLGNLELVKMLLDKGAKDDINAALLYDVRKKGDPAMIALLGEYSS